MYKTRRGRKREISMPKLLHSKRAGAVFASFVAALAIVVGLRVFASAGSAASSTQASVILSDTDDSKQKAVDESQTSEEVIEEEKEATSKIKETRFVVHIDGAVATPGVYTVEDAEAARVQDIVDMAGGLTSDADTTLINLAAKISDGQKLHIPKNGEVVATTPAETSTGVTSTDTEAAGSKVNINTATAEELQTLPGVGAATAQNIVKDRDKNGPFSSPEDLMRISGIGQKKFDKLKDNIYV